MNNLNKSKIFSSPEEYNKFLDNSLNVLKNKNKDYYIFVYDDQSIKEVGGLKNFGEQFRTAFGFVKRTSKKVLEYQFIRVLTFGASNNWIDDTNEKKIKELAQLILNNKPADHVTLNALVNTIEDVRKNAELKIDFNKFNEIYFERHQDKLANRYSFKVMCIFFFKKICKCFFSKVKQGQSILKQQKEESEIKKINLKKNAAIKSIQLSASDVERLQHLENEKKRIEEERAKLKQEAIKSENDANKKQENELEEIHKKSQQEKEESQNKLDDLEKQRNENRKKYNIGLEKIDQEIEKLEQQGLTEEKERRNQSNNEIVNDAIDFLKKVPPPIQVENENNRKINSKEEIIKLEKMEKEVEELLKNWPI
jgi:hypothetical protein